MHKNSARTELYCTVYVLGRCLPVACAADTFPARLQRQHGTCRAVGERGRASWAAHAPADAAGHRQIHDRSYPPLHYSARAPGGRPGVARRRVEWRATGQIAESRECAVRVVRHPARPREVERACVCQSSLAASRVVSTFQLTIADALVPFPARISSPPPRPKGHAAAAHRIGWRQTSTQQHIRRTLACRGSRQDGSGWLPRAPAAGDSERPHWEAFSRCNSFAVPHGGGGHNAAAACAGAQTSRSWSDTVPVPARAAHSCRRRKRHP